MDSLHPTTFPTLFTTSLPKPTLLHVHFAGVEWFVTAPDKHLAHHALELVVFWYIYEMNFLPLLGFFFFFRQLSDPSFKAPPSDGRQILRRLNRMDDLLGGSHSTSRAALTFTESFFARTTQVAIRKPLRLRTLESDLGNEIVDAQAHWWGLTTCQWCWR